jgi:curved DNA-binding protein CbpA
MAEKLPRLVANVDVRQFKLDPMDGFLLTRIDGRLGPKELARETGLPEFQVVKTLEKLEKLKVIELFDPNAPAPAPAPPVRDRTQLPEFASIGLEPKYDPRELDEAVDLTTEQKRRVLDLFYRLDDLDHYTLLGVGKDADKKTVKRSYFELAAVMHPDRYFKKNLGSFKGKMEQLFGRVTEAHDALTDAARRAEYDAYLDEVATTRGMEAMFERALDETRRAAASAEIATPAPMMRESVVPAPRGSSPGSMAPVPSAADMQARREALAKRLLGGQSVRPTAPSAPPIDAPNPLRYTNSSDAMDALKRRYEERIDNATANQAKKYIKAADDALSKNDVVAAASSLQIATKFAPDDVALAMRYQETKNRADEVLGESYVKQATYEERAKHWPEAARSWQKVAKIKVTDPAAHERAAFCILMAENGDLHQGAEHAKQAVMLEPAQVVHHLTLAEIYLKAGLGASARRAAEAGLALDAKHVGLAAVLKKATKT